jgi:putative transposase
MPRSPRIAPGGVVYHVLNRANARITLFEMRSDYEAFMKVFMQAHERTPVRVLSYCIMPNHWHFVLWPQGDGDLSEFVRWLTLTHTQRWHAAHGTTGSGHLYQGRFKSLPVQTDGHFLTVCRYVERNPLRAGLVSRAESWPWSSLSRRSVQGRGLPGPPLAEWPLPEPANWLARVNEAEPQEDLDTLRRSIARGTPYGPGDWVSRTAAALGLDLTLHARGRPRKEKGVRNLFPKNPKKPEK